MENYTAYAKSSQFESLPAGGYIAKIIDVDDRPWNGHREPAHLIMMDIAEGEHKDLYQMNNFGADKARWLTYWFAEPGNGSPEWLLSKVGGIQTSLAESNAKVNLADPHAWKGKLIGVVVGEEEVESQSGTVYTRPYVSYVCSTGRIQNGGFKIPKLKTLEPPTAPQYQQPAPAPGFTAVTEDIPF